MRLYLDTETISQRGITDGTYAYAEASDVLLTAWAIDDGPVRVEEGVPEEFARAFEAADELVAHNAQFDRLVLANAGLVAPIEKWRCTMARALAHSLPGGLGDLCKLLSVPQDKSKDADGKRLVRLFCIPSRGKRGTAATHPEEWARFKAYAAADVEALREVHARLPATNYTGKHLDTWHLDQKINDLGVAVDTELAAAAIETGDKLRAMYAERTAEMTGGAVASAQQRDRLLTYLRDEYGVPLTDLARGSVEKRLADADLPAAVRDILALRLASSFSASRKFAAVLRATSKDGRLRGTLQFCGASRTGRWAGRVFQPQNLPRPPKRLKGAAYDAAIADIKAGLLPVVDENPMETLSGVVRGVLVAPPGRALAVADWSSIEARVVAWLAGQDDLLAEFAKGVDIYRYTYAKAFGGRPDTVSDEQRQIGKVQVLALGYQGAVGAVRAMAGESFDALSDEEIVDTIVRPWRDANRKIVKLWYAAEDAAKRAVADPGKVFWAKPRLAFVRRGTWLYCVLPSGRCLCYPHPAVGDDGKLSYAGTNQYTRAWGRINTYGGKLVENATQAVARDVLADTMLSVYREEQTVPALTIHDEVIYEVPAAGADLWLAGLLERMRTPPQWGHGLPLDAAGFVTERYRKG